MSLLTQVTTRFSNQRLVELTNQDARTATSYNATVLAAACTDAEAEFETLAGVVYDDNEPKHVVAAIRGVLYHLHNYRGIAFEELQRFQERFEKACEDVALVTSRNRILPRTNSQLTVPSESANGETIYPDFDREAFDGLVPRAPTNNFDVGRPDREA